MSHIQNLEVNKVTSTKQVSEAGNHDMPQRALRGGGKQKKKKHVYTVLFNHLYSCKAVKQYFTSMNLMTDVLRFLTTASNNRFEG